MSVSGSDLHSDRANAKLNVKETTSPTINNSLRNGSKINARLNNSTENNITNSESIPSTDTNLPSSGGQSTALYTMDTDISQLEAPTFTTIDRGPSQTMIDLTWDHKVNLIGKKVNLNLHILHFSSMSILKIQSDHEYLFILFCARWLIL